MIITDLCTSIIDLYPLDYFKIYNFASETRRQCASSHSIEYQVVLIQVKGIQGIDLDEDLFQNKHTVRLNSLNRLF